jgi:uncharacterized protein YqeY
VPLEAQVDRDLVAALKEQDRTTLATLRLLKAAAKNAQVAKRAPLSDEEYVEVIRRQVKLRREAAAEYEKAGRAESAAQEREELSVLERYLPAQMDDDAIRRNVQLAIAETGATGPGDLGKVMKAVMPRVRGQADGARVNAIVRQSLEQQ